MGAQYNQTSCMQGNVTPSNKPCIIRITTIAVTVRPNQGVNIDNMAVSPIPKPNI